MERLPAIRPGTAPALGHGPRATGWVRPAAALLVTLGPPLARAAWRRRARMAADHTGAVPVVLERTELWLERRRLGRLRLQVRSTRFAGIPEPPGDEPGAVRSRVARWVGTLVWRLLIAAVGGGRRGRPVPPLPSGRG